MKTPKNKAWAIIRAIFDIDQILIFALLAVTVNQLGHYLATFQDPGLEFIGYLQAIGIDATIWRCAHWFKTYRGRKQRMYAGIGLAFFLSVSAWFNAEYYLSRPEPHGVDFIRAIAMGAVLPLSVAAVSYLHGIKEASAFATKLPTLAEETQAGAEARPSEKRASAGSLTCETCERVFSWPAKYANRRAAQNAMNAHTCRLDGDFMVFPAAAELFPTATETVN